MSQGNQGYMLRCGKPITGTLVWYYFICKREVWLMSHEITPDEESQVLDMGRAVHEIFYSKMLKEISMEGVKIDLFKKAERIICEVKTSSKFVEAARFQLLYYIFRLKEYGVDCTGWVLIPTEKRKIVVKLDDDAERELLKIFGEIKKIVEMECPPSPVKVPFCKKCAYREFCWA
ncbi:MAG: CRISPR-associated protein Cas4 [Nitrososphaerota archaeon]|nr:CRISPR-associated protein Cas4 [Nitrososphaerota archaeon]